MICSSSDCGDCWVLVKKILSTLPTVLTTAAIRRRISSYCTKLRSLGWGVESFVSFTESGKKRKCRLGRRSSSTFKKVIRQTPGTVWRISTSKCTQLPKRTITKTTSKWRESWPPHRQVLHRLCITPDASKHFRRNPKALSTDKMLIKKTPRSKRGACISTSWWPQRCR